MKNSLIIVSLCVLAFAYFINKKNEEEPDNSRDIEDYANSAIDYGNTIVNQTDDTTKSNNLQAFLNAIRYGEGTHSENGYSILFGGRRFYDYDTHPAMAGWGGVRLSDAQCANAGFGSGCVSTAAGAYQINRPTYNRVAAKLGITDFTPASQDRIAVELISEKGAINDVETGDIAAAVKKVRKVWASLPAAGYGQSEVSLNSFLAYYETEGGVLA